MAVITDQALHEITRPVCNQEAPITARNYEISDAQALQIGAVISCNQDAHTESGDYKDGPEPRVETGIDRLPKGSPLSYPCSHVDEGFSYSLGDVAWAAGFFDGEGCIVGMKQGTKDDPRYVLHVSVVQVDRRPLEHLKSLFGGRIHNKNRPSGKHQDACVWVVTEGYARNFLRSVLPYLRVKGERAQLALRLSPKVLYGKPNRAETLEKRSAAERDR